MRKDFTTKDIRNVCIVGGSSTGKTSLSEAIFYSAGLTNRLGSVDDGTTISDYNDDEIERKISINNSIVSFEYKTKKINLIDTPGFADFLGETISAICVCDTAVFVLNAEIGLDAASEDIYQILIEEKKPLVVFMNKLDKTNIELDKTIKEIEQKIETRLTPINAPIDVGANFHSYIDLIKLQKVTVVEHKASTEKLSEKDLNYAKYYREKLIDAIASCDDALLEKYLDGKEITEKELIDVFKIGFNTRKIIPVIFGSGLRSVGISLLLDFFEQIACEPSIIDTETEQPTCLIFKTTSEPGMGQMNYGRIYSGKITTGIDLYNFTRSITERIGQMCYLQGKRRFDTHQALSGDIVAFIKLKSTRTTDLLVAKEIPSEKLKQIKEIKLPLTVLDMAIYPKTKGEEEKVGQALQATILEDPTIKFNYNPETKEVVVSGLGNVQLEVMVNRIKSRYGVDVELKQIRIPYKETVKGSAEVQGKYKRQSGGRGQYGDCWLKIEPLERGKGFEFVDRIREGKIPKNYIPAVEKGVIEAMEDGVIAGYPVIDLRVTLYDGSFHEVDSSDMAFKIAASIALKKGVCEAKPFILEPIMNMEIVVPEVYLGSIIGDLNSRRGRVLGMEPVGDTTGKKQKVLAQAPLSEVSQYAIDLRSMTKGAGKFKMEFAFYEELPTHLAQNLIDIYQKSKK
ncbi:MAG: elongation factor G [Elusimicrobiota bacterium]|nr:elongation factor G [Elusimicrobiota bacterium]